MAMKESLHLKNSLEIIGNPNKPNTCIKRHSLRVIIIIGFYEGLLKPPANDLKQSRSAYPLTVLYFLD